MSKKDSLKNLNNLSYDTNDSQSSLIQWYNRLIDKSVDELSVTDVSKMIRQHILREVAINRAIELLLVEPFAGEMLDGGLLDLLLSCGAEFADSKKIEMLIPMIMEAEKEMSGFDWQESRCRLLFETNLAILKSILHKNKKDS